MGRKTTTGFYWAVRKIPELQEAFHNGLQALKRSERPCVLAHDPARLTGSICLDAALRKQYPSDHRWDYGIGYNHLQDGEKVTWIEFHPASSHHVKVVIAKLIWLKSWLETKAPGLRAMTRDYYWIATGGVAISPNSPQAKQIAKAGLRGPCRQLKLE
ncbi:hypothetical protein [Thermogutta terrifontis]|uniref:hypothetical protein n=1 Tax=Thermogutta terrifontis TaxID=1331910 RepID=UPI0012FE5F88|nr:hypothetical protein [Thermogutta terrifontis]